MLYFLIMIIVLIQYTYITKQVRVIIITSIKIILISKNHVDISWDKWLELSFIIKKSFLKKDELTLYLAKGSRLNRNQKSTFQKHTFKILSFYLSNICH
ncbi:MAG: hypothetical protein BZ137_07100 [Methanosphaera sp. rholeuAM130]|nr:MAG: hypothetical protein BZ137_07100 [Methanosphaera sp. rholeuAM130]